MTRYTAWTCPGPGCVRVLRMPGGPPQRSATVACECGRVVLLMSHRSDAVVQEDPDAGLR